MKYTIWRLRKRRKIRKSSTSKKRCRRRKRSWRRKFIIMIFIHICMYEWLKTLFLWWDRSQNVKSVYKFRYQAVKQRCQNLEILLGKTRDSVSIDDSGDGYGAGSNDRKHWKTQGGKTSQDHYFANFGQFLSSTEYISWLANMNISHQLHDVLCCRWVFRITLSLSNCCLLARITVLHCMRH